MLNMNAANILDRYGNLIYLTEERWQHILESRPELEPYFEQLVDTIRDGKRKQDPLIPNKYRYYKFHEKLLPENNHLVVVVIFKTSSDSQGIYQHNNFVVTAWANYILSTKR